MLFNKNWTLSRRGGLKYPPGRSEFYDKNKVVYKDKFLLTDEPKSHLL